MVKFKKYKIVQEFKNDPFEEVPRYYLYQRRYLSLDNRQMTIEILCFILACLSIIGFFCLLALYFVEDICLVGLPFGWEYIKSFNSSQEAHQYVAYNKIKTKGNVEYFD